MYYADKYILSTKSFISESFFGLGIANLEIGIVAPEAIRLT